MTNAKPLKQVTAREEHQGNKSAVTRDTLSLRKVSGGFLSNYPVEFTKDSNYFFCCTSDCIKIYSVATGEVVRTLSSSPDEGGHSDMVTCVMLNPNNALQLFSSSLDGTIKLWDFNDSVLLKTYNVGVPITHMTMHSSNPDFIYIVTNKVSTKRENVLETKRTDNPKVKKNSVLIRFSLRSQTRQSDRDRLLKARQCAGLQMSLDGAFLIMAGKYKLHVWKVDHDTKKFEFKTYMSHERITCLASHPTEPCVATGDDRGRITLWYCFTAATVKKPVTSTLHWHAHQVNYMTFTADGVYLLSGGEEAVLVIWQLETGHRQYLPRLGSEIRSITVSPDQSLYALGHLDNSVRVFNALDLDIKQAIQGLKYAQTDHLTNPLSTGLVIEPRNHHVVLNGVPGTLQFYNAYTDRHVLELEVTPRNKASRTDDKEIVQPHVDLVAFWGRGEWMATVDSRDDGETTPELYLKFWRWDPDAQSYTLNTRVDAPHAVPITSLAFHPAPSGRNACPLAITTSKDKTFKIWHLVTQPGAGQNEYDVAWACRSIGVYRDYVPHHAAFSDDGSILAVAYGQIVTLWDPYTNTFQGVLVHPPEHRVVKRIEFLGGNSTFLVSVTRDHLYVWNLLTCTVWWSYQIKVDHLAADRQSSHFIVANNFPDSSDCRFLVFDPRTPIPVLIHSVPDKCRALAYLPRDDLPSFSTDRSGASSVLGHSNVIFLNQKWDLHVLGQAQTDEGSDRDETDARDKVSLASITPAPKTYFSDIFGTIRPKPSQEQLKAAAAAQQAAVAAAKDRAGKGEEEEKAFDLLSAPSHVMPSVATVFEAFMEGLLGKVGEVKEDAGRMEEDRDDEKDDEEAKEDQMDVDVVVPSANELSVPAPSLAAQDLSEQEVAIATKGGAFGFLGNQFLRQLTAGDKPNGHVVAKQAPSTPHYPKTNGVFANGKANGTLAHDISDTDMEPEPRTGWNDKTPVSARTPKKAVVDEEARRVATPKKAVVDEARAVATPKSAGKKRKQ